ncbi:hypothetical protein M422DRAFT_274329 [Sphaerobolus stellatus SS14]|uniref:Uncharacterized protein n=1 Tax=Sphaerobolus stellatus (strain SS14) TaxID=990650 RepID=A0A0C9T761_SPHS4|nr:hypothetical protein M422DRAFT_274329 [Sphaerobolus stellatus SS14]
MSFTQIWGNFLLEDSWRTGLINGTDVHDYSGPYLRYRTTIRGFNSNITTFIRITQSPLEPALPNGTVAFIFGRLCSQNSSDYRIEALHLFPYPSVEMGSNPILNQYLPRITVAGHVVQEPQYLTDGTCLFPVNAVTYVREQMQAAIFIASIVPSKCWDNRPPCPKAYSPVHITDPLDCIDRRTLLPVIVVEDLTLQAGDHRLAALANKAHHSIIFPESPYHLIPDQSHQYIPSTASLSSIPPYPNPLPLPISTPTWWKDNTEKLYPPFEASSEQTLAILSQPPGREYLQSQEETSVNNQPGQDLPTSYALTGARDEETSEKH